MLLNIIIGLIVIGITVTIQAYGSLYWSKQVTFHIGKLSFESFNRKIIRIIILTASFLLILNFIESFIWALAYYLLPGINEFHTLEKAVYFSLVTFTTLGYGDITISSDNRILAGLEAINGILLIGCSSAIMISLMQQIWSQMLKHEKEIAKEEDTEKS
jgi:voltage-gated potassium channel Kch